MTTSAPAPSQLCFFTGSDSQAGSRSMCMLGWGWGAGQHLLGLSLKVLSWVTERSNCCGGGGGAPGFPSSESESLTPYLLLSPGPWF